MNPILKRWLHWAGGGIGFVGIVFIAIRLHQYSDQLDFHKFGASSWFLIIALSIVYGSANYLLATAWYNILGLLKITVSRKWAVKTYGVSQLAKYVPGNIFQFAGRQALGLAANLPGWLLAKSIVWELALISLTGFLFVFLTSPLIFSAISVKFSVLLFLLFIIIAICLLAYLVGQSAFKAFGLHLLFLTISGSVFVFTLGITSEELDLSLFLLYMASYIVAWLIGLVTPGAPAGVGIREVVLLFLLGANFPKIDLLLTVVLNRMITVTGDTLFFLWCSMQSRVKHLYEKLL